MTVRRSGIRRRWLRLSVVIILGVQAACSPGSSGTTPFSSASTPTLTPPPLASVTARPTFHRPAGNDAFDQLLDKVAGGFEPSGSELDNMWRDIFANTQVPGQGAYVPPAGVAPYLTGEVPPVGCAAGTAARFWAQNAFFCPADDWIVYDETWLRDFDARHGDFAPAAVLAHEWGHHIQQLLGEPELTIQSELQADCFAGMYLAYRELPPGATAIVSQSDEFDAALRAMFDLADHQYSQSVWFQEGEHGSSYQRILAFGTGSLPLNRGLPWCYGYRDYTTPDFEPIGPYRLLNLPGRIESWQSDTYLIAPELRAGDETSAIRLRWLPALPLANVGATPEQLQAVAASELPDAVLFGPGSDPRLPPKVGSAWMMPFDAVAGTSSPESGMAALFSPSDALGGLLVVIYRNERYFANTAPGASLLPEGLVEIREQTAAAYQISGRLCGPDQSPDFMSPQFSLACVDDQ